MKVSELQVLLAKCDPDATVLVAGFETAASRWVAEANMVTPCTSLPAQADPMSGNRCISNDGNPSVWIGWSEDYRTETFLDTVSTPENY
ncbi:hypothetical protein LF934_07460 [Dickeya dadantii]|uniref:hypothetical protein n=1 Tax=Dickeya dadantii TaxID=204038 RepID=UPI001CF291E2|nr:hypothetical protein [Dickeya dadantii]MCA7012483.1 hypothetical protein [Dickeya dadantii]